MVADPATFRVLPWANNTGWVLCDIYFPNGKPVPFSTRALYRDALARLAQAGFDYLAGLEVEFQLFKLRRSAARDRRARPGRPRRPRSSTPRTASSISPRRASIRSSRSSKCCARPCRRSACRCARSRSSSARASTSSPSRRSAGLRRPTRWCCSAARMKQVARRHGHLVSFMCRPRLPNAFASGWHLHQSLLDAKIETEPVRLERSGGAAVAARPRVSRRPARARARGRGLHHADRQRLQALSRRQLDGADPGDLGARQPRRDDPRAGRAGRSGDASGEPRRRAAGQSVSLHGVADSRRPRRHRAQARARRRRPTRPTRCPPSRCRNRSPRRSRRSTAAPASARASATRSSITIVRIKEAEIARCDAAEKAGDPAEVTAWEHKEYFDLA